jgi:hypothetical protein
MAMVMGSVRAMHLEDDEEDVLQANAPEFDQMNIVALLEEHSNRMPLHQRDEVRRMLLTEYSSIAQRKARQQSASLVETLALAEAMDSGEKSMDSASKSETDANAGARLSPVDTPQDLVGAPRMTPACRRQLHNYLTDCVFDGKSADANKPNCYQIYSVWARDCFNGGIMPSEKKDE